MSDQLFEGFSPPTENWSKLPHQLINALHIIETEAELKVILYILRHTWGYHDEEKKITLDEFCNGRKRKDGSRIDNGTGLSRNAVRDGLERAEKHRFICQWSDTSDKARIKKYYRLAEIEGQSLTPRGSEVDPLQSEVDPRTEKETKEINSRENIPSDFLETVVNSIGKTSEVTAPNPKDQYWEYRDEFLKIVSRLSIPNDFEKDAIINLIEDDNIVVDRWKKAVQQTGLHYKGSDKIARAIEVYLHGEGDYEKWRQWKYPDNGNHKDRADFVPKKINVDDDGGMYL